MRARIPTGTVTLLFTDVEGSTKLLQELGAQRYAAALAEHRSVVREACSAQGGVEVDTQGDAFFVAFSTAPAAVEAARVAQKALADGPIRVRMGLHTGTPRVTDEGYVGVDVHRGARIAAVGHGGQVLLSQSTRDLIDAAVRDLGLHRLKDLSAPERLFQLGDGEFPPLRSLNLTNLPVQPNPFLGRERELAEVLELARQTRLLTLTGPGGSGKTRLALQAAALLANEHEHGVWWVPLAAVEDERLVLESAAQAVRARDGLAEHVGDKSLLLLFDNFEHVVGAAAQLAELLSGCPNLTVFVTSRQPLRISAEQEYPVPPFAHAEAVRFFLARARAASPSFQPDDAVDEICRRLDDLPLALELAAARVKSLSSRQILDRLAERLSLLSGGARDLPERQRTLRDTIASSYNLLADRERQLFRRLSVFSAGCTLEAAEAVCDADLDTLASLVDKSLLRLESERYTMLETIREYAATALDGSDEVAELHDRHAGHFLALAQRAEPELEGRDAAAWLARLDPENDNLRRALQWFRDAGRAEELMGLSVALGRFWTLRGQVVEGLARLEDALRLAPGAPARLRATALYHARRLAHHRGDVDATQRFAQQQASLAREVGDPRMLASALRGLGIATLNAGDGESAIALLEDSLDIARAAGDLLQVSMALENLGLVAFSRGDLVEATRLLEDSLALQRELGDEEGQAATLSSLGSVHLRLGDLQRAAALLRESLELAAGLRDLRIVVHALSSLAGVVAARGDPTSAVRLLGAVDSLARNSGHVLDASEQEIYDETVVRTRVAVGEPAHRAALEEGAAASLDDAVAYGLKLV